MKANRIMGFIVALLVVGFTANAQSANQTYKDWQPLGTRVVDYTIDHDVIQVNNTETFTAVKVGVKNGIVKVHKATVHFKNGETQEITLPDELTKGNDGKVIDLVGNKRAIDKITFWYDTKGSMKDEKAVIELWAKK